MSEIRKAIKLVNERWMAAFSSGDAARVAGCYSENARMMPPDGPTGNGREGVEAIVREAMTAGIKECRLETVELEEHGDLAVEIGRATLTVRPDGGDESTESMKYVVIWKNEGGEWRMHIDIWNSAALSKNPKTK